MFGLGNLTGPESAFTMGALCIGPDRFAAFELSIDSSAGSIEWHGDVSLFTHAMENGMLTLDAAVDDGWAYDDPCTVHSDWYTCVAVDVTDCGVDAWGHPRRSPADNPERVEGHY